MKHYGQNNKSRHRNPALNLSLLYASETLWIISGFNLMHAFKDVVLAERSNLSHNSGNISLTHICVVRNDI